MKRLGTENDDYVWFLCHTTWWSWWLWYQCEYDDHDDCDINVNVMITMILCGSMSRKQGVMWQLWHLMCETPCKTVRHRSLKNRIWKINLNLEKLDLKNVVKAFLKVVFGGFGWQISKYGYILYLCWYWDCGVVKIFTIMFSQLLVYPTHKCVKTM